MGKKREVTSQDHFQRPHLGTSPGPQDLRVQQFQRSQRAPKLPQGTAPGETWLLRACVWQQGQEQQGLEQGWKTGCGGGWLTGSAESLQSRDYISMGRGTGRGSLRDTVERRLPVHGHLQELGHKVGSCLGLLDSVSLHDPAFLVQA